MSHLLEFVYYGFAIIGFFYMLLKLLAFLAECYLRVTARPEPCSCQFCKGEL